MGGYVIPLAMTTSREQQQQLSILIALGQSSGRSNINAITPMSVFGIGAIWGATETAQNFGLIGKPNNDDDACK